MAGYYKDITIPTTAVTGGPHGPLPVTVYLGDDADLASHVAFADGRDIHFETTGGVTLPHVLHSQGHILSTDAAGTWFNGPSSAYSASDGKTWFPVHSRYGVAKVIEVDHDTESWTINQLSTGVVETDDHDDAGILQLDASGPNAGKLLCAWSVHNGNSYSRVSTNAGDATSWATQQTVNSTSQDSYVQLAQMGAADSYDVYWFFRRYSGSGTYYPHYYRVSSDGGATWTTPVQLISVANNRPYLQVVKNSANRIDIFFTTGQPNETTNSIYHFYIEGGNCYQSDGTLIRSLATVAGGSPIGTSDATLVWDGATANSWVWDARVYSGSPVLAFVTFPTTSDHRYRQARLVSGSWATQEVATANGGGFAGETYYSPGIAMDPDDIDKVLVGRYESSIAEMQEYELSGTFGSGTWSKIADVSEASAAHNIRPEYVNGATGLAARRRWFGNGTTTSYTDYWTCFRVDPPVGGYYKYADVLVSGLNATTPTTIRVKYGDSGQADTQNAAAVYPDDLLNIPGYVPLRGTVSDLALIGGPALLSSQSDMWTGNEFDGISFNNRFGRTSDRVSVSNFNLAGLAAATFLCDFEHDSSGASNAEHTLFSTSFGSTTNANAWQRIEPSNDSIEAFLIAATDSQLTLSPSTGFTAAANTRHRYSAAFAQTGSGWTADYRLGTSKATQVTNANTGNFDATATTSPLVLGKQLNDTSTTDALKGGMSRIRVSNVRITNDENDTLNGLADGSSLTFGDETEDSGTTTATPDPVSITFSVPTPTVRATVKPDPVVFTFSVATPSIRATAKPSPFSLTFSTAAPTIRATVKPDPAAITFSVPAPTLPGQSITVTPDPVAFTFSIPTPRVLATVKPSPVSMVFGVTSPSIRAVVKPSAVAITFSVPTPTIGGAVAVVPTQADIGWTSRGHKSRRLEWTA